MNDTIEQVADEITREIAEAELHQALAEHPLQHPLLGAIALVMFEIEPRHPRQLVEFLAAHETELYDELVAPMLDRISERLHDELEHQRP